MTRAVPIAAPSSVAKEAAEVIRTYADAFGEEVWLWEKSGDGWSLIHSTSAEHPSGPSDGAVEVAAPHVGPARLETSRGDAQRARFLADAVARAMRHELEAWHFGREIAERYEEITLLYSISEILGSVISLEEAAQTILAAVADTLGVARAALWLQNRETERLELVASVGGGGQTESIELDDDSSITARVFRERRSIILDRGDVFPRDETVVDEERDSSLFVPVSYTPPQGETRTIGVINLIGRSFGDGFSAGNQKLITAIATQIGSAVENNRLIAESLRQERFHREMELAHHLQLKLLPSTEEFRDYAEVAARCVPADSVGGDFYHLFRLPGGRLGVMIGDVSSHGFGAALIMALTMSAAAIHASEGDPPAEVLRRVHRTLIDELESTEMYLTLFYGVLDPEQRCLAYANAGHSSAFRVRSDGTSERLDTTNPPFGIVDLDDYGENTVDWSPGEDLLFLFTDGLADAISPSTGEERLLEVASTHRDSSAADLLHAFFQLPRESVALSNSAPPDDRTALLVRI